MTYKIIYYHRLHLFTGSGQTIQIFRDYHALAELGYEIHLFYFSDTALSTDDRQTLFESFGLTDQQNIHLHLVKRGWRSRHQLHRACLNILQAPNKKNDHIVVCRTLDHVLSAFSLRKQTKLKILLELHETAIPSMIYQSHNRPLKTIISKHRENRVFTNVDGIICTAPPQLELLNKLYPKHTKTITLPNGVDLSRYPQQAKRHERFTIAYTGHFNVWKNLDILFEAMTLLPDDIQLLMAGGTPGREHESKTLLDQLTIRFNLKPNRITYAGFLSPHDIPAFQSAADILVLTLGEQLQAKYFTSPMKFFEYAASQTPMVVTDQPTTNSLVTHGQEALLVPKGSAPALAEALLKLYQSETLRTTLAQNAKQWVQQFSYSNRAQRYHRFLHDLAPETHTH